MAAGKASAHKTDKALGHKSKAIPFDADRRVAFIEWIRKGASISQACKLEGVSRDTAQTWLKSGRSDTPRHPEHRHFAREYDKASAEGIVEVIGSLRMHAEEGEAKGTKAALAMLGALDPRYGDRALKRRSLELSNERAELDNRMALVRVTVAEAAANGTGDVPGFGLAVLLGDEEVATEVRQAVASWAVRKGYVAVERLDWDAAPGAQAASTAGL